MKPKIKIILAIVAVAALTVAAVALGHPSCNADPVEVE